MKLTRFGTILLCLSSVHTLRIHTARDTKEDVHRADLSVSTNMSTPVDPERSKMRIISLACGALLTSYFTGQNSPDCSCDPSIFPLTVKVSCQTSEQRCVLPPGVLCGYPQYNFEVKPRSLLAGKSPAVGTVCYNYPSVGRIGVLRLGDPFCVDWDKGRSLSLLTGGVLGNSDSNTTKADDKCTARFGKAECTSCTVCDTAGSVFFNCSNIFPHWVSPQCSPLPSLA